MKYKIENLHSKNVHGNFWDIFQSSINIKKMKKTQDLEMYSSISFSPVYITIIPESMLFIANF